MEQSGILSGKVDRMEATHWKIIGASVAGTSHLKQGKTCDDAHAHWQDEDGSLLLVVADGAGSARYAEKGARVAPPL